jgi:hypothetical protein
MPNYTNGIQQLATREGGSISFNLIANEMVIQITNREGNETHTTGTSLTLEQARVLWAELGNMLHTLEEMRDKDKFFDWPL